MILSLLTTFFAQALLKLHLFFTLLELILTLNEKLQLSVTNITYLRLCKFIYAECSVLVDKSLTGGGYSAIISVKKLGNL